jgi:hypothetical protein
VKVWSHSFLTSALDGGEWSDGCPGCFILEERRCNINNNMVSITNLQVVFIDDLFNNSDSTSDHTLPNYRIINE